MDAWGWEVPAGSVKPDQTELEAAVCELKEEVGGETNDPLVEIGRFYTANGICNELGIYYLATNVTLGEPAHEAAEVMEIHLKPIDEVLHMAQSGYTPPTVKGNVYAAGKDMLAKSGLAITSAENLADAAAKVVAAAGGAN